MNRQELIALLPPYRDEWVMVNADQSVRDIVKDVLGKHKKFAPYYDCIAARFDGEDTEEICGNLYHFLKDNIRYQEESDADQTTALPTGILTRGYGDCKHYASFAGGVLDALNRKGKRIDWNYRFASYRPDPTPHHVFIVARVRGREVWIDPTPGVNGMEPIWIEDHKIKGMALRSNIAGIEDAQVVETIDTDLLSAGAAEIDTSVDISKEDFETIAYLLDMGVVGPEGGVNEQQLERLYADPAVNVAELKRQYARFMSMGASVGGFFDGLWRGVKVVSLAIPRNSFLLAVTVNLFGMATKMLKVLKYADATTKLMDRWYSLGGKKDALESAIRKGGVKKPILAKDKRAAVGEAISTGAVIASAAAIIAAIMPLVTTLLKSKSDYTAEDLAYDQYQAGQSTTGNALMDFYQQNKTIVLGAGALLLIYFLWED